MLRYRTSSVQPTRTSSAALVYNTSSSSLPLFNRPTAKVFSRCRLPLVEFLLQNCPRLDHRVNIFILCNFVVMTCWFQISSKCVTIEMEHWGSLIQYELPYLILILKPLSMVDAILKSSSEPSKKILISCFFKWDYCDVVRFFNRVAWNQTSRCYVEAVGRSRPLCHQVNP